MNVITDHLGEFGDGLLLTVELTLLALAGALATGTAVAAMRVSPVRVLRAAGMAYVEVLQNIPLLVWLVIAVFGLPEIGVIAGLFTTSAVVIALYQGAYTAEAIRSGINAVPAGQGEAARALGLTFVQSLRLVVLPQALRTVVQPLGNIAIMTLMNTALAAAVGVVELTAAANRVNLAEAQPIWIFVTAGLAYMALSAVFGLVTGGLERKLAILR
ncbi:glutamate transport system permease protein [Actinomadura coerulea]|uniref:Glutamate transport system permease protein n=1 Tax=Actinomadura coerulea TaxID=46159 RepID=A0A7X0KYW7_9ACTN|nr:amino acid ABC transporter permease [Actinomadura coerulea]MBB6395851.1 glutamate transport system permease protein [Actinomadura coerulea]GGQ27529.1 amino acid ABC transporter permease [Actinomadura coerulea]